MKTNFILVSIVLLSQISFAGTDYYVRTDGSDSNDGLKNSADHAWRTVNHAVEQIEAGDTVYVAEGTYAGPSIILAGLQATEDNPTRIVSMKPLGAAITRLPEHNTDTSVVVIYDCAYLEFEGFEVYDHDLGIESGIDIRNGSHHITVRGCYVRDCGCGGISSRTSDYLTIEDNILRGNARRNKWNCSGLSVWHPIEHDQKPGYHIIFRQNVLFENECERPFTPLGHDVPTDGNGIIIDDFNNTQGGGQIDGYKAAVLVENNVSFNNGGRAITVYESGNVTVRNNTSFHNNRILSKYHTDLGDITVSNAANIRVYNNLVVQHPDQEGTGITVRSYNERAGPVHVHDNLVVGGKNFCPEHVIASDNTFLPLNEQSYPRMVNPTVDVNFISTADFRKYFGLQPNSPAIDSGDTSDYPAEDRDGQPRPIGSAVDLGAYEHTPDTP